MGAGCGTHGGGVCGEETAVVMASPGYWHKGGYMFMYCGLWELVPALSRPETHLHGLSDIIEITVAHGYSHSS